MKTIRVVAAVICDSMQEKRKIYATARGECEIIWATREKPDFMRVYAA